MAYTPLNIAIYTAAFGGAIAGIAVPSGAFVIDPSQVSYATQASIAAIFAQAVDTAWAGAASNDFDLTAISHASSLLFHRGAGYPLAAPLDQQSNWTTVANAIVAMVKEGDANATGIQQLTLYGSSNIALGIGTPTTATNGNETVIAAVKLIAKSSGLFRAWASFDYTLAAAADQCTFRIAVFTDAVTGAPLTLSNTTAAGFGSDGTVQPGNVQVTDNGPFVSSAGAGITIAGGSQQYLADAKVLTIGTGAVGTIYSWSNIIGVNLAAAGSPNPFPIGQTCLFRLSVQNSVAARVPGEVNLGMFEV